MKKLLGFALCVYLFMALLVKLGVGQHPDSWYITVNEPYKVDSAWKRKQDSQVNRALIKKDTKPFKGRWVNTQ
jgi:hypothetical protein